MQRAHITLLRAFLFPCKLNEDRSRHGYAWDREYDWTANIYALAESLEGALHRERARGRTETTGVVTSSRKGASRRKPSAAKSAGLEARTKEGSAEGALLEVDRILDRH